MIRDIPKGYCLVQLQCADTAKLLRRIADLNIGVLKFVSVDELTVHVVCGKEELHRLKTVCEGHFADMKLLKDRGLQQELQRFFSRPVLILGLVLLFALSLVLPGRVLFLRVEGNTAVPAEKILEAARLCGIDFGVRSKSIRSEEIKNAVISQLPELRWVGVNIKGCVATISVREYPQQQVQTMMTTRIVASCDGVVTYCTVLSGQLLCAPGQAVREGDTLISGEISDGGITIEKPVSGEIYANTHRTLRAVMPSQMIEKGAITKSSCSISLLVGKKRIFIYNNSRISGAVCDKIYEEKYITLPNGFQLPLGIAVERHAACEAVADTFVVLETKQLELAARNYLQSQMISGEIRDAAESLSAEGAILHITGVYICHELIGREETEDLSQYGENN